MDKTDDNLAFFHKFKRCIADPTAVVDDPQPAARWVMGSAGIANKAATQSNGPVRNFSVPSHRVASVVCERESSTQHLQRLHHHQRWGHWL